MTVLEQLKSKTLEMRKARSPLSSLMQFHLSEVSQIGKNAGNRATTDDEAIQYLKKAVQKLKENTHSNPDEIVTLEQLLPQMASDEDIVSFLETLDIKNMNKGQIMGSVKKNFGTLVDMKRVGELLKENYDC